MALGGTDHPRPIGPWAPKEKQGPVRQLSVAELKEWTLLNDDRLFVVNKPGDVVCHPSKDGPWSSLVGAAREYLGVDLLHLVFRLDRETSGVVVFAKSAALGRTLQMAAQERRYRKVYLALLAGEMTQATLVDQPLGDDYDSPVRVKTRVVVPPAGQPALSRFTPLARGGGFTLASVVTGSGRKHQIRAHASWLGYPLVGDKIYGPDDRLFLEFVEHGWTPALERRLLLPRQALHCAEIDLSPSGVEGVFRAPLPPDLEAFCGLRLGLSQDAVAELTAAGVRAAHLPA